MADDVKAAAAAAAQPVDLAAEPHTVLMMCGMTVVQEHNNITTHEGFNTIANLAIMEGNSDVIEMVKCMASHTEANGCINLSIVAIKCLQGLVYCVRDCEMHGLTIMANNWTAEVMQMAMNEKEIKEAKKDEKELSMKDMGKFNWITSKYMTVHSRIYWPRPWESEVSPCTMLFMKMISPMTSKMCWHGIFM